MPKTDTTLQQALSAGDTGQGEHLAGGPPRVAATVVHGQKLGRQLGAPTANLVIGGALPGVEGSFAAHVWWQQRLYPACAHLGVRPSVAGDERLLEVHLLDFEGDLYHQRLEVELLHKVSVEKKLDSFDQLRQKIAEDVALVRQYFAATSDVEKERSP